MRPAILLLAFCLLDPRPGRAQDQEPRLVNRLLRPDTTLQNSAQGKQFLADGSGSLIDKKATTRVFYAGRKPILKETSNLKKFSTEQAATATYRESDTQASIPDGTGLSKKASLATRNSLGLKTSTSSNKKVAVTTFAENRAFLAKGKSQKALDQQKAPMTVEQVRELLNKNK